MITFNSANYDQTDADKISERFKGALPLLEILK